MKEKCADEDTSKEEAEKEVDKYKKDIILVSMFVVWEGIYIFDYRRRALKELHNQEIDEEKNKRL